MSTSERLVEFGARTADCVELSQVDDPRVLRYVDLVRHGGMPMVDTIVEEQSQPLLYVIDATRLSGPRKSIEKIAELRRKLAMRGDPAWLGILSPGRLDIYSTDLRPTPDLEPTIFCVEQPESISVLPRLAQGEDLATPSRILLRDVLFGLMTDAGQELKDLGLTTDESIALTGRALFFRYLMGRKIIDERHLPHISLNARSLEACFSSAESLAETNAWLDRIFNGDILKLPTRNYPEYFRDLIQRLGNRTVRPLEAILGLDLPIGPGASQIPLNWGDLDFDHVPVGLLSETYEELMYRFDAEARRNTSVYYTPSHIAEYMVAEALYGHSKGSHARVLDPACGAGVFLVAAFRQLAEKRFAETGSRPDRRVLREILNNQLVGFDINTHARTLAALALYLTALELDPAPTPVEALTFEKLEGRVLIDVADPEADTLTIRPMAGSLGKHVPEIYRGAFDLVVGNPPWTSLTPAYKEVDHIFTERCREIALRRGLVDIAQKYRNPDRVPDLPFVWGAMDWAKPGGRIALALAGRWLFKMSPAGFAARKAIFNSLAVTGILNGASLRQSRVWPNVDQPFCLLFADNRLAEIDDQFILVSPDEDPELNAKGRMRIDANDAEPVSLSLAAEQPDLIKTLYRGSTLDVSIIRRIREYTKITIGEYWSSECGLYSSQGYQVASRSNDDAFLKDLPNIGAHYSRHPFVVKTLELPSYQPSGLHRPRQPEIYRAPLVLVREGNRADRSRGRALISDTDLAYSESYYGFSAAGHEQGEFLTQYLLVLIHSQVFEYFTLMASGKFGLEREALQVRDVEEFPFVPPENLSHAVRASIESAASNLTIDQPNWEELDKAVLMLYGLGKRDAEVIRDTLSTRSPFPISKKIALTPASAEQGKLFCTRVENELANVLGTNDKKVSVKFLPNKTKLPWKFISISLGEESLATLPSEWIEQADNLAVSRLTIIDEQKASITIGLLDRYRYWTQTQARLLASDIIWQHGALLEERSKR